MDAEKSLCVLVLWPALDCRTADDAVRIPTAKPLGTNCVRSPMPVSISAKRGDKRKRQPDTVKQSRILFGSQRLSSRTWDQFVRSCGHGFGSVHVFGTAALWGRLRMSFSCFASDMNSPLIPAFSFFIPLTFILDLGHSFSTRYCNTSTLQGQPRHVSSRDIANNRLCRSASTPQGQ